MYSTAVKIMNVLNSKAIKSIRTLLLVASALGCAVVAPQAAQAGEIFNGWNYSIDSFKDGTEGSVIGNKSAFEFYGLAFREYDDKVVFAVNSNLSLDGYLSKGARGGSIGYGDLFINFADTDNFANAEGSSDLYAVKFAQNDTTQSIGLYSDVTSQSLTTVNQGYSSIKQNTNTVSGLKVSKNEKGEASFGDLEANTTYFNQNAAARTNMKSGTYASSVTMLDSFDSDLDFGNFGAVGKYTFGFSVEKSSLQIGNFVAHLFAECGNDGVVLDGQILGNVKSAQPVPESSPVAGLAVVGMMSGLAWRKRKQAKVVVEA